MNTNYNYLPGKDERILNSSVLLPQFGLLIEPDDMFSDTDSDLSEYGDVEGSENGELEEVQTTFRGKSFLLPNNMKENIFWLYKQ